MAGWADVALAVGSAATGGLLTGVFLLINSKKEHKAALERLEREQAAARDKEERERRRAIRDEPLRALRTELVRVTYSLDKAIESATLREELVSVLPPGTTPEVKQAVLNELEARMGRLLDESLLRALYQVDDQEVQTAVRGFLAQVVPAYVEALAGSGSPTLKVSEGLPLLMALIHEKLEEP